MSSTEGQHEWWITTDSLAAGGSKVLGPFGSKDLAFEVRRYVELATAPSTYWVDSGEPEAERKLALIGRDSVLIEKLAKQIWQHGLSRHAATEPTRTSDGRGFEFQVQIHLDGKPADRIAKVAVTLDRVEETGQ